VGLCNSGPGEVVGEGERLLWGEERLADCTRIAILEYEKSGRGDMIGCLGFHPPNQLHTTNHPPGFLVLQNSYGKSSNPKEGRNV
jgi:hypothetical protein